MGDRHKTKGRPQTSRQPVLPDVPAAVVEVEIGRSLEPVSLRRPGGGRPYARALCLVRLHGRPLGILELRADEAETEIGAGVLAERIWDRLAQPIAAHLRHDGWPVPASLPAAGLRPAGRARCTMERDAVRARAPRASVVVATRERPDSLRRCLDSLLALDYPDYEIVVVDNAPETPETGDLVRSAPYRDRVTYTREERQGLAAAHNRGLSVTEGAAIIAFTDDDVIVDRLWLLELARGFECASGVACVTGLIMPAELETPAQLIAERRWGWAKGFSERVFDRTTDGGDPLYPYTAGQFGSGANMAFQVAALRSLGGFDPATGAGTSARGGDDLAGFFSVISAGYRLVYNPAALVRHAHSADYEALKRQAYGYGVGLTAYLTKTVIDRPGRALQLGRCAGRGLARARRLHSDPGAAGGDAGETSRPRELVWAERRGMAAGPAAYMRSRWRTRRATQAGDRSDAHR